MTDPQTPEGMLPAEREDWEAAASVIGFHGRQTGVNAEIRAGNRDHHPMVQAFARHRAAALIEGARMMQDAALRAHQVAQYDPAPYTKGRYAIQALDPAEIVAKQEG